MSSPSQARILVNTVSEMAAPSIKVGDSQIDVTFSSWNSSAETAELVFTVPVSQTAGQVYGLVSFGGSFTPGCSTDCCARKSCAACGRGIVCFTLAYFDDSQPGVVLLSESAGPDVGGHVIVVQLIRFPMVSSAKELSAQFQVAGVPVFAQALMLDYSAPDDTVVQIDGLTLEKPQSREEAADMLRRLSGRTHEVTTAFCLVDGRHSDRITTDHDTASVSFGHVSDELASHYIQFHQPFDKAGAYGAQDLIGMCGIHSLKGSFYTVMGLPMHKIFSALQSLD